MRSNTNKEIIEVVQSFDETGKVSWYERFSTVSNFLISDKPNWNFATCFYKPYVKPIECYVNIRPVSLRPKDYIHISDMLSYQSMDARFCIYHDKNTALKKKDAMDNSSTFKLTEILE